jgi:hypothetical protein
MQLSYVGLWRKLVPVLYDLSRFSVLSVEQFKQTLSIRQSSLSINWAGLFDVQRWRGQCCRRKIVVTSVVISRSARGPESSIALSAAFN